MNWETLKSLVVKGATLVDVQFSTGETVYSYITLKPKELEAGDYVLVLNGDNKFGVAIVNKIQEIPIFDKGISYMPVIQKLDQESIKYWREQCNTL